MRHRQHCQTMRLLAFRLLLGAAACVELPADSGAQEQKSPRSLPASPRRTIDYRRDVETILAANCYSCHGVDKQKSDLRLDRKQSALRGGAEGVAIVPGDSAGSPLILRVSGIDVDSDAVMPPK